MTTHQSEVQARDVDDVVLPASSLRAFDALSAHVALLDGTGGIRWVNEAWRRFGIDNGADPRGTFEGADYDAVCEAALPSPDAGEAHDALRLVLDGHSFRETVEYPCHAPDRERWFRARFERIAEHGEVQIVAVHENVTDAVFAARGVRETARLTRQLQTALLGRPAVCRHYDVATSYRPGDSRLLLGGDFLDVLEREDGTLVVMIGDVAGHGPEAAALGATLRAAWRTLALSQAEPAFALAHLDAVLRSERRDAELFATVAGAWIDRGGGAGTCAVAGHPPPLLVGAGRAELLTAPVNPPLGCFARPPAVGRFVLPLDHSLLLYTDGLTDARLRPAASDRLEIEGFVRLAAELDSTADEALDRLLAAVMAVAGEGLNDDAALVAVSPRRGAPAS